MTSEALNHDESPAGSTAVLTCRSCVHFDDDPARLEAEVPGILVFGSAYGSSRGHAGLCAKLGRFHDPIPAGACPAFEKRAPVKPERSSDG
ncbi:MAG: hypothetical protein AB1Z65_03445 [Candidatus Sulfomarinibacteraceae bacterium]